METYCLLVNLFLAPAVTDSTNAELVIVGIDHTLEMESRRETSNRQVYLRGGAPGTNMTVGTRLTVHRTVHQGIDGTQTGSQFIHIPQGLLKGPEVNLDDGSGAVESASDRLILDVPIKLTPLSGDDPSTSDGSGVLKSEDSDHPITPSLEQRHEPVGQRLTEVQVGLIELVATQDGIWVAEIIEENHSKMKGALEGPDVVKGLQIGDRARVLRIKKTVKKTVKKIPQTHRAELIKERDRLLRDMRKRGRKVQPYKRSVNRWDL